RSGGAPRRQGGGAPHEGCGAARGLRAGPGLAPLHSGSSPRDARLHPRMGGGVIGSTTGFGPVRAGSNPAPPATPTPHTRGTDLPVHVLVLAAGKGTRMRSDTAKVHHRAAGRTLLDWVLDAVAVAKPDLTVVVAGHQAEAVAASLEGKAETVVQ